MTPTLAKQDLTKSSVCIFKNKKKKGKASRIDTDSFVFHAHSPVFVRGVTKCPPMNENYPVQ